MADQSSRPEEKTFRAYSDGDASKYAQHRLQYSDALYNAVLSHHTSTGGQLDTVVDLGCGPGIATFRLAESFPTAIGLDAGEAMINTARSLQATAGAKAKGTVRFEVSAAEDISPSIVPDESVDLITAATCAHWFDMPKFWPTAARILRPNGTVALWCSHMNIVHPSNPNAAAITAELDALMDAELEPFMEPGNLHTRDLYARLGLPWTVDPPVPAFDESKFERRLFGTEEGSEPFYAGGLRDFSLDMMEKLMGTASPVTRWRQAHPEAVGTEQDLVRRCRRIFEKYLHQAGVPEGQEKIRGGSAGVVLLIKKSG